MTILVEYSEMKGYPTESVDAQGNWTAQRQVQVAWEDRHAFMAQALGGSGEMYEYTSSVGNFRARGASSKPFGKASPVAANDHLLSYEAAIITLNYKTPDTSDPQDVGGDDEEIISESLEPTAEFVTLNHENFRWGAADGDELKPEEAPGRLIRGLDYVFTRYRQPSIASHVLSLIGATNNAAVYARLLGLTFATDTLLYQVPSLDRSTTTAGTDGWNIRYRLSYKAETWNKFWRADAQAFQSIYIAGGARYLNYAGQDFSVL